MGNTSFVHLEGILISNVNFNQGIEANCKLGSAILNRPAGGGCRQSPWAHHLKGEGQFECHPFTFEVNLIHDGTIPFDSNGMAFLQRHQRRRLP